MLKVKVKVTQSCPTLCDPMDCSLWNSPGQNTGVGSLFLLQQISLIQESNQGLLHCRQILSNWAMKEAPSSMLRLSINISCRQVWWQWIPLVFIYLVMSEKKSFSFTLKDTRCRILGVQFSPTLYFLPEWFLRGVLQFLFLFLYRKEGFLHVPCPLRVC